MKLLHQIVLVLSIVSLFSANTMSQTASAVWPLTSTTTTNVNISGSVTGSPEAFSNTVINSYTGPTGPLGSGMQRVTTTTGSWPAESAYNNTRYIEFTISPTAGNKLTIDSVSLPLAAAGGSNMRAEVFYSTNNFSTSTKLNGSTLAPPQNSFTTYSYGTSVIINQGETFSLRIFPFYTSSATGKYICAQNIAIYGITQSMTSVINVTAASLPDFGLIVSGGSSSSSNYSVSALQLTENLKIKAPSGFQVSSNNISFFDSIEIALTGDSIPITPIYAKFSPTSALGSTSGSIVHSSLGADPKNVSVSGISIASEPVTQSSITFGTVTGNSIVVNFTGGSGSNRILVAKNSSAVSWSPSDGSAVTGVNNDFSLASDQGSGNKVVYDGTGGTVIVTGLMQSTTYHFAVYEYNVGTNNSHNFNITSPGTGSQSTIAVATINVNPVSLSFGNIMVDSISVEKTYSLSANTLSPTSGNITITAPAGYELSTTSGSGFSQTKQVPYNGGALAATTIYVRFKPTSGGTYSGNITNAGGGAETKNVAVLGNGVTPSLPNVLQAEEGLTLNSKIQSQYSGYSGWGYVDIIDRQGCWLEVSFRRATASSDTLTIYYANGSGGSRSLALYLNDGSLGSLSFPKTTNWSTWSSIKTVVSFVAGVNRVRLQATGSSATPNIDYFFIGGSEAIPVYKLNLYKSGNGTVSANPSQTYYDAGTQVLLSASPSGNNIFSKWIGGEESTSSSLNIIMNNHKTMVGVMLDTTNFAGYNHETSPIGFASMNALGNNGTTGGAGGSVVYINNSKDLYDLMFARLDASHSLNLEPITIYIVGTLSGDPAFGEMLDVKDTYDASIIGVGQDAIITGFGLNLYRAVNIIVRNIKFASWGDDAISVDASDDQTLGHHIWVDHCTFTYVPPPGYPAGTTPDGSLDITHTAAYVTVSWCHFYKTDKNSLVGHSDGNTQDVDIKVTYHHNYFDSSAQRNPRVRFGKVHAFNNYYRKNTIYSISSNTGADVVVEGNYFLDCPIPTESGRDGGPQGDIVEYNNVFVNCGTPEVVGTAFDPSTYYSFTVDPPANIPEMVTKYAGSGKYDFSPNPPITSKTLNLTVLIEGFYNGSTQVSDTVTVQIHNSVAPYALIEEKSTVLNSAGNSTINFNSALDGTSYYLALRHRNALETWSKNPQQFSAGSMTYDFTTSADKAFGDNLVLKSSKYCTYSGDVNQDGVIDLTDVSAVDVDNLNFMTGYLVTDVNGDNLIDISDLSITDFNNLNFISKQTPTFFNKTFKNKIKNHILQNN